jgi:hypothetical protein
LASVRPIWVKYTLSERTSFQRSEEFGVTKDNFKINMPGVRDRKRKMVAGLVDIHLANFKASGAELIKEEEAILWRSLGELPPTYREPLVLFYRQPSVPRGAARISF